MKHRSNQEPLLQRPRLRDLLPATTIHSSDKGLISWCRPFWLLGLLALVGLLMLPACVSHQTHQRTIEELELRSQHAATEIERLEALVQDTERKHQLSRQTLDTMVEERKALATDIIKLQQAGRTPDEQASAPAAETQSMDYPQLSEMLSTLRDKTVRQREALQRMHVDRDALSQEVSQLETRLADATDRVHTQEQALAAREANRMDLQRQVAELQQDADELRRTKEAETAYLATIREERHAIEQELAMVSDALEQKVGAALHVTQDEDRLVLTVLGHVLFESGDADLTPLGMQVMSQIGAMLSGRGDKDIHIEGHTDNQPILGRLQQKYPSNWELSTARATRVLRFLVDKTGLPAEHFVATGYGHTRPVSPNDTDIQRSHNRRVEIILYPRDLFSQPPAH